MSCIMHGLAEWRRRSYVAFSGRPSRASSKLIHLSFVLILNSSLLSIRSYLHINGFIHRDIKAANLLIDDDGTVLLGDLGVAAPLNDEDHNHANEEYSMAFRAVIFDSDVKPAPAPRLSKVGKRRSFVGTVRLFPWKSGISHDPYLSHLSHAGWLQSSYPVSNTIRAPTSGPSASQPSSWLRAVPHDHENPLAPSFLTCESHAVQPLGYVLPNLGRTNRLFDSVEAAPPTLDRNGGVHKYSRAFKEIVERCLVKDPSLRFTPSLLFLQVR
jgi:serine/threonine-protein kinase OSR1/STK39